MAVAGIGGGSLEQGRRESACEGRDRAEGSVGEEWGGEGGMERRRKRRRAGW